MRKLKRWIMHGVFCLCAIFGLALFAAIVFNAHPFGWISWSLADPPGSTNQTGQLHTHTFGIADASLYYQYELNTQVQWQGGSYTGQGYYFDSTLSGHLKPAGSTLTIKELKVYTSPNGRFYWIPLWAIATLLLLVGLGWISRQTWLAFRRDIRLQTNLCLHCGYNLTGVESDKCPECGAARPLVTVSSAG